MLPFNINIFHARDILGLGKHGNQRICTYRRHAEKFLQILALATVLGVKTKYDICVPMSMQLHDMARSGLAKMPIK